MKKTNISVGHSYPALGTDDRVCVKHIKKYCSCNIFIVHFTFFSLTCVLLMVEIRFTIYLKLYKCTTRPRFILTMRGMRPRPGTGMKSWQLF